MLLTGLRGFITGAGTGIGRAIALEMVREGADLAITDIDLASAQKVANEAQALRADARFPSSGYKRIADWGGSAVIDFNYLELVLAKRLPPAGRSFTSSGW